MRADSMAVEIVSPMLFSDTDCVCRVAKAPLAAVCAGCGESVYQNVHLPLIAYGMFCSRCCPCVRFVPTAGEAQALADNHARSRADAGGCRPVTPDGAKPRQIAPRVAALRLIDYRRSDVIRVLQPKTFSQSLPAECMGAARRWDGGGRVADEVPTAGRSREDYSPVDDRVGMDWCEEAPDKPGAVASTEWLIATSGVTSIAFNSASTPNT